MPCLKGRYWILTIPTLHLEHIPEPRKHLVYLKGQKEEGANTGLIHWQLIAQFDRNVTLGQVKEYFCPQAHCELTRSDAANEYVWKKETRIEGTQFELGRKPTKRNCAADWEAVREDAKTGNFSDIPADIYIKHYGNLKRIRSDNTTPTWRPHVEVAVYWGGSGLGKSRRAWFEAGETAYAKDPNTKWWDSYQGQENVIIDEFTGVIAINHILRWLDRYPCLAEVKGCNTPLKAVKFWITSNIDPRMWYPDANPDQVQALLRRCSITHFWSEWLPPTPVIEPAEMVTWERDDPAELIEAMRFEEGLLNNNDDLLNLLSGSF